MFLKIVIAVMLLKNDNGKISTKAPRVTFIVTMLLKCLGSFSVYRLILFAGPLVFCLGFRTVGS